MSTFAGLDYWIIKHYYDIIIDCYHLVLQKMIAMNINEKFSLCADANVSD